MYVIRTYGAISTTVRHLRLGGLLLGLTSGLLRRRKRSLRPSGHSL